MGKRPRVYDQVTKVVRSALLTLSTLPIPAWATPPRASSAGPRVIARCGPVLKLGTALPAGAKLYGHLPAAGAPLYRAAITNDAPATADPIKGLNEVEPDDSSAKAAVFMFSPEDPHPLSVACSYGATKSPPFAQAFLLIPIPDKARGQCRLADGPTSRSMVCTAH